MAKIVLFLLSMSVKSFDVASEDDMKLNILIKKRAQHEFNSVSTG